MWSIQLLAAYAAAISQDYSQRSATRYSTDVPITPVDIGELPVVDVDTVGDWFTEVYTPTLDVHRDEYYNKIWKELESEKPALL